MLIGGSLVTLWNHYYAARPLRGLFGSMHHMVAMLSPRALAGALWDLHRLSSRALAGTPLDLLKLSSGVRIGTHRDLGFVALFVCLCCDWVTAVLGLLPNGGCAPTLPTGVPCWHLLSIITPTPPPMHNWRIAMIGVQVQIAHLLT